MHRSGPLKRSPHDQVEGIYWGQRVACCCRPAFWALVPDLLRLNRNILVSSRCLYHTHLGSLQGSSVHRVLCAVPYTWHTRCIAVARPPVSQPGLLVLCTRLPFTILTAHLSQCQAGYAKLGPRIFLVLSLLPALELSQLSTTRPDLTSDCTLCVAGNPRPSLHRKVSNPSVSNSRCHSIPGLFSWLGNARRPVLVFPHYRW